VRVHVPGIINFNDVTGEDNVQIVLSPSCCDT